MEGRYRSDWIFDVFGKSSEMELFKFIGNIAGDVVDALGVCSAGDEEKAKEQMLEISKKIQNNMPAIKKQPAPWPGRTGF